MTVHRLGDVDPLSVRVSVYRNLHTGGWSIKTAEKVGETPKGKVIAHADKCAHARIAVRRIGDRIVIAGHDDMGTTRLMTEITDVVDALAFVDLAGALIVEIVLVLIVLITEASGGQLPVERHRALIENSDVGDGDFGIVSNNACAYLIAVIIEGAGEGLQQLVGVLDLQHTT
jgi:hypothetical protein